MREVRWLELTETAVTQITTLYYCGEQKNQNMSDLEVKHPQKFVELSSTNRNVRLQ